VNKFTKIVATIGPASSSPEIIKALLLEGADVFRMNFSHGTFDEHLTTLRTIREVSSALERTVCVFQDLQGPKIRVGAIKDNALALIDNETLVLSSEPVEGGIFDNIKKVSIDYPGLCNEAKPGDRILMDDGLLEIKIDRIEKGLIYTNVIHGGILKPHKGVNLPHVKLSISALTEKDRRDLEFAFIHELDFVALSFVRNSGDIKELSELMQTKYGKKIPIIAKIEKPEAIADLDNIIDEADAIMVARGDLGVETSPQEVPVIQKEIIRKSNASGKPVITATQMLESMINNPTPTRAEANDVANAIFDGSDAVMLSAETASGKYPVEAVRMMKSIALQVEDSWIFKNTVFKKQIIYDDLIKKTYENPEEAVCFATVELAEKIWANYIVTFTHSGGTARNIAKYRPIIPIVAISPVASTVRRLMLTWGVTPLELGDVDSVDELLDGAAEVLKFKQLVKAGDYVVITAGVPVGMAGSTNMVKVVKI
jgi:pyruvate kinase